MKNVSRLAANVVFVLLIFVTATSSAHLNSVAPKQNGTSVKPVRHSRSPASVEASAVTNGPDSLSTSVSEFSRSVTPGSIDCRFLTDIPGTLLCLTLSTTQLRTLMGRVSYFVEGVPNRKLVPESDAAYMASPQAAYAGHDIMASDFNQFYAQTEQACAGNAQLCLNEDEAKLKTIIQGAASAHHSSNYVVIAAQAETDMLNAVVGHELLHARFFLNEHYQEIVTDFWKNSVTAADKVRIQTMLGRIYDVAGVTITPEKVEGSEKARLLLLNEFQAYILMLGGENFELAGQVPTYKPRLKSALGSLIP